eukprot:TRINITY_DN12503_c0_g1_i3.p1 TRINITY_DN12503_c0_g1~~TRINITY_DN12503_c0_g1_i3.p1  ORF type:complete len:445 (+),score=77.50 TRINITY_DN12503_c0_g1_i3:96-1430(+)
MQSAMAQRAQSRSTTLLLSVTALATAAILVRNRRLRQWLKSIILFEPLPSESTPSSETKNVYEGEEDDHGIAGLDAICSAVEEQLANAKAGRDYRNIRKLRRVLSRLYDAMDVAQGREHSRLQHGPPSIARWAERVHHSHHDGSEDSFQSAAETTVQQAPILDNTVSRAAFPDEITAVPSAPVQDPEIPVYVSAMQLVQLGQVACRKDRTQETQCLDREDFLARLHCLREASTLLLATPEKRKWVSDAGRSMIGHVLEQAQGNVQGYHAAWTALQDFIEDKIAGEEYEVLTKDLTARGCPAMSLFDCVIDYVLLDAFDDMKKLPSSVQSVLSNTWVPRAVKEQTLSTAVWSVLSTRKALCAPDGLMIRFYGVMEHVSPVLACGLLGCHSVDTLEATLNGFKDLVLEATAELFAFDEKVCTTAQALAEHTEAVLRRCEAKANKLC